MSISNVDSVYLVVFGGESRDAPGLDLGDVGLSDLPESAWAWASRHGSDGDGDPNVWVSVMDHVEILGASLLPNYRGELQVALTPADLVRYREAVAAAEVAAHADELVEAAEADGVDWDRD